MTHKAGVCCGGLLRRSSWCRRVTGQIITQRGSGCCWSSPPLLSKVTDAAANAALLPLSPQWTLSHSDEARTSSGLCGADQLTNDREEGGAEEGIKKREGGILCNGVESTKERHQAHAFVICGFLHPPLPSSILPPSLSHLQGQVTFVYCLWIEIVLIL